MRTPLPWSHSILSMFENCPHQFSEVKVYKRVQEKPIDKREWGIRAHKALEDACAGRQPLGEEFKHLQPFVELIRSWQDMKGAKVYLEHKLAINKDATPCGFFADDVWARCVHDVLYIQHGGERAIALDWKFGRRKTSEQMLRAALITFINYPNVNLIRTDYVWAKEGVRDPEFWTRDSMEQMWEKVLPVLKEYRQAFKDERWPKRESGLCRGYCPVSTCEYYREKPNK